MFSSKIQQQQHQQVFEQVNLFSKSMSLTTWEEYRICLKMSKLLVFNVDIMKNNGTTMACFERKSTCYNNQLKFLYF